MTTWSAVALGVGALTLACSRSDPSAECAVPDAPLERGGLTVRVDAQWIGPTELRGGHVPACRDDGEAARAFRGATEALEAMPTRVRPANVDVHVVPRPGGDPHALGVRFFPASGVVVVERGSARHLTPAAWLHELAHVSAGGNRPKTLVASRLLQAIDEGFADYFAAVVTRSPELGDGSGARLRDLRRPPPRATRDWALLALASAEPGTHRLGWQLASELWREEPESEDLAVDLLLGLAELPEGVPSRDVPAEALRAVSASCPERSRGRLVRAFRAWVPAELFPD